MNKHNSQVRDLRTRKEFDQSRPYPCTPSHWTEAEFIGFLNEHRFPPNTYRDRLAGRRNAVITALASGEFVPDEVVAESPDLLGEAAAMQRWTLARDKDFEIWTSRQNDFMRDIGFSQGDVQYRQGIREILLGVLNRDTSLIQSEWSWRGWPIHLSVDRGRRPVWGYFGPLDDGRPKSLQIRLAPAASPLHNVAWELAEDVLCELLLAGQLDLERVWFLTGVEWLPAKCYRTAATRSDLSGLQTVAA